MVQILKRVYISVASFHDHVTIAHSIECFWTEAAETFSDENVCRPLSGLICLDISQCKFLYKQEHNYLVFVHDSLKVLFKQECNCYCMFWADYCNIDLVSVLRH